MRRFNKINIRFAAGVLAVFAFVTSAIMGYLYYSRVENGILRMFLAFQNGYSGFVFSPEITLVDTVDFMQQQLDPGVRFVSGLYCAAVIIAPLCTIHAIYSILDYIMHPGWFRRKRKNKKQVPVFRV